MPADREIEAAGRKRQLFGVGLLEMDVEALHRRLAARLGQHRRREIDAGDAMPAGRQFEAEKTGAAAGVEHGERRARRDHQIEDAVPRGALGRAGDAVAEILVEARRAAIPMGRDLLLYRVGLPRSCLSSTSKSPLFQSHHFRQRLDLLGMARHRVQQQVVGAHRDHLLEPLAHLLGRAVDAAPSVPGGLW